MLAYVETISYLCIRIIKERSYNMKKEYYIRADFGVEYEEFYVFSTTFKLLNNSIDEDELLELLSEKFEDLLDFDKTFHTLKIKYKMTSDKMDEYLEWGNVENIDDLVSQCFIDPNIEIERKEKKKIRKVLKGLDDKRFASLNLIVSYLNGNFPQYQISASEVTDLIDDEDYRIDVIIGNYVGSIWYAKTRQNHFLITETMLD